MTRYVKFLDCPDYVSINEEIYLWIKKQTLHSDTFWNPASVKELIVQCPKFQQWLLVSKLLVSTVAITYGTSPDCCGSHIDTKPARFKLSRPVKNAIGTWNRWFRVQNGKQGTINSLGGTFYRYEDLVEIHRQKLTGPCIIDAGIIHDVWYDRDVEYPRIGLQCQLFKEPTEL